MRVRLWPIDGLHGCRQQHRGRWPGQGQEQTRNITCMVMMVVFATDCMPTSIIVYAGSLMLGLPRYLQKQQGQLSRVHCHKSRPKADKAPLPNFAAPRLAHSLLQKLLVLLRGLVLPPPRCCGVVVCACMSNTSCAHGCAEHLVRLTQAPPGRSSTVSQQRHARRLRGMRHLGTRRSSRSGCAAGGCWRRRSPMRTAGPPCRARRCPAAAAPRPA